MRGWSVRAIVLVCGLLAAGCSSYITNLHVTGGFRVPPQTIIAPTDSYSFKALSFTQSNAEDYFLTLEWKDAHGNTRTKDVYVPKTDYERWRAGAKVAYGEH